MEDLHPNFGPSVPLVKEGMMQGHGESGETNACLRSLIYASSS